jgi:hypothetical protein
VKRHKKIKDDKEDTKPKVNPNTVYVPYSKLTDEEKSQRRLPTPQVDEKSIIKKKKKTFSKINIQIPKITELRDHPSTVEDDQTGKKKSSSDAPPPKPLKQKKTLKRSTDELADIHNMFKPPKTDDVPDELKRLSIKDRVKNITTFSSDSMNLGMKTFIFECADMVEIVRVVSIELLPITPILPIPGSKRPIPFSAIPLDVQEQLSTTSIVASTDPTSSLVYEVLHSKDEKEVSKYFLFQNAYHESIEFLAQFSAIKEWLQSLTKTKIPWKWFVHAVCDLGIVLQQRDGVAASSKDSTWVEYFRVLCLEYKQPNDTQVSVPIVPFLRITLSC